MNNPFMVCSDRELRALPAQWLRAEQWDKAGNILYDLKFMDAIVRRLQIDELLQEYATALRVMPENEGWRDKLSGVSRVLERQAYYLHGWDAGAQPAFFLQQLRNESIQSGLDALRIRAEAELAQTDLPYLCERFRVGWESPELIRTLAGHRGLVWDAAMSADGRVAVSALLEGDLEVWDVATSRVLFTLKGHREQVHAVALSTDGCLAISGSWDRTAKIWDVTTGRELRTLPSDSYRVEAVALSADGRLAVTSSSLRYARLHVWDVASGRELCQFEGDRDVYEESTVNDVALSADGRILVSALRDKTLEVWDVMSEHQLHKLKGHSGAVRGVALSADGRLAISSSDDRTLKVWDIVAGREICTLQGHSDRVGNVALSADGRLAVSSSWDKTLKVWDVAAGCEISTLRGHGFLASSVTLTADGRLALSGGSDGTLKLWDLSKARLSSHPALVQSASTDKPDAIDDSTESSVHEGRHSDEVRAVAVSGNGQVALSASEDRTVKVWDVATGRLLRTLQGHSQTVIGVAVSADGRLAVSTSSESSPRVWDLLTGHPLRLLEASNLKVISLSPDGRRVFAEGAQYALKVWDLQTDQEVISLEGHKDGITCAVISANGQVAISAAAGNFHGDYVVKVWDVATGREIGTLPGAGQEKKPVRYMALSADGRVALTAPHGTVFSVWDVETGTEFSILKGHSDPLRGLALSADGRVAVSVAGGEFKNDYTLRAWDVKKGKLISTLAANAPFLCCAITPDGKNIVAGDKLGVVHFVELNGGDPDQERKVRVDLKWLTEANLDWSWIEEIQDRPRVNDEDSGKRPVWLRWFKGLLRKRGE